MKTYYQVKLIDKQSETQNSEIFVQRGYAFALYNQTKNLLGISSGSVAPTETLPVSSENNTHELSLSIWQDTKK